MINGQCSYKSKTRVQSSINRPKCDLAQAVVGAIAATVDPKFLSSLRPYFSIVETQYLASQFNKSADYWHNPIWNEEHSRQLLTKNVTTYLLCHFDQRENSFEVFRILSGKPSPSPSQREGNQVPPPKGEVRWGKAVGKFPKSHLLFN